MTDVVINKPVIATHYKLTGSVAHWVLRNKLDDAFMVWMLARYYDRLTHKDTGRSSGIVYPLPFLEWVTSIMAVTEKTAKERIEKAVRYGFLKPEWKYIRIVSHRKVTDNALFDQYTRADEAERLLKPCVTAERLLQNDQEYTRELLGFIDFKDRSKTRALLTGIVCVQETPSSLGRKTQGRMINVTRRTVQRRCDNAKLDTKYRYVIMDVSNMLDSDCRPDIVVKAFEEAESIYRHSHGYNILPGRKLFHHKYISSCKRTALVIQVPSTYSSKLDVKVVPALRAKRKWLQSGMSVDARSFASSGHYNQPVCRNFGRPKSNRTPDLLVTVCEKYVSQVLEDADCRELILARTGATTIFPVVHADAHICIQSSEYPLLKFGVTQFDMGYNTNVLNLKEENF